MSKTCLPNAGCRSLRELAAGLNSRSIKTPRGSKWYAASVWNLLSRLDRLETSR
ncbi:recombinase family protein [Parasphingorhabdus sp.]|uniref:recombinase family protein n=1 Tax=Parasphingorhabdus sp. TaxID=2709688 RepID=UPI0039E4AD6C